MRAYIYDVSDSEDGQAVYIGRRPADNFEEYEPVLTLYYDGRIGHADEPEWPGADVDATTASRPRHSFLLCPRVRYYAKHL